MKKALALFAGAALFCLTAPLTQAQTFTFNDHWNDWPGFNSGDTHNDDINGTHPSIEKMIITINDSNVLQTVQVVFNGDTRLKWDSLFINTNMTANGGWDHWDYFVHDGGTLTPEYFNGVIPGKGLYTVNDPENYDYTTVKNENWRVNNPNGIDKGSLTMFDSGFTPDYDAANGVLTYNLSSYNIGIAPDDFFFAYAPYCANDVMGTPEPATMLLFGTGLIGLIGIGRKRSKRS